MILQHHHGCVAGRYGCLSILCACAAASGYHIGYHRSGVACVDGSELATHAFLLLGEGAEIVLGFEPSKRALCCRCKAAEHHHKRYCECAYHRLKMLILRFGSGYHRTLNVERISTFFAIGFHKHFLAKRSGAACRVVDYLDFASFAGLDGLLGIFGSGAAALRRGTDYYQRCRSHILELKNTCHRTLFFAYKPEIVIRLRKQNFGLALGVIILIFVLRYGYRCHAGYSHSDNCFHDCFHISIWFLSTKKFYPEPEPTPLSTYKSKENNTHFALTNI